MTNKCGTGTGLPSFTYTYSYYLDGNQYQKTENGKTTTYTYDGLGRLTKESESGTSGITKAYTYDKAGNRATMAVSGGESYSVSYVYDANNRLESETKSGTASTYTYDKNGNQLTRTTSGVVETSTYDCFNRLTGFSKTGTTASYTYKPNGLRLSKTVNGTKTTHIWDGSNIVLELNASNVVVDKYVRGINLIKSNNSGYFMFNAHGDVTVLVPTSGGTPTKVYSYDAFGVEVNKSDSDNNPWRYCGEYYDKESDTIYLRARYYSPRTGRFTQQDPIRAGLNWYTYCLNSPIRFIDPWGLKAGDQFANKQDAVEDMYEEYYGITDYTQFEIGAVLYKTHIFIWEGTHCTVVTLYSYTDPRIGEPDSVQPRDSRKDMPKGSILVAYIHSHPGGSEKQINRNEGFSKGDNDFVNDEKVLPDYQGPLYVLTPKGSIYLWTDKKTFNSSRFSSDGMTNLNTGTQVSTGLKFNELSGVQKHELMMIYGPRLMDHINSGLCESGWHLGNDALKSQALIDFLSWTYNAKIRGNDLNQTH